MNINELAESDLKFTLEDKTTGFAVDIELINGNESVTIPGSYNQTHKVIDPATGLEIISQNPSIVLRRSTLQEKIDDGDISNLPFQNWLVNLTYNNIDYNFFIMAPPKYDNRLGTVIMILGVKN